MFKVFLLLVFLIVPLFVILYFVILHYRQNKEGGTSQQRAALEGTFLSVILTVTSCPPASGRAGL